MIRKMKENKCNNVLCEEGYILHQDGSETKCKICNGEDYLQQTRIRGKK